MYSFHTDNESWTFRFDYAPKLNKELDGRFEEMLLHAKAWKGPKQGLFSGLRGLPCRWTFRSIVRSFRKGKNRRTECKL